MELAPNAYQHSFYLANFPYGTEQLFNFEDDLKSDVQKVNYQSTTSVFFTEDKKVHFIESREAESYELEVTTTLRRDLKYQKTGLLLLLRVDLKKQRPSIKLLDLRTDIQKLSLS